MKVTKLREDWNHIFKPHQGPMTAAQQDMLDKVKAMPGTMGVQVLQAPDAALTAFPMTNESLQTQRPTRTADAVKRAGAFAVVLPISPTRHHARACPIFQRRTRLHMARHRR